MMKTINKADPKDVAAHLAKTADPIPEDLVRRSAKILVIECLRWLESEEGKKEVNRIRTNRLHREEYSARKGA